jgi:aminopeptidase N
MMRRVLFVAAVWLVAGLVPTAAQAITFQPGAAGIGDMAFFRLLRDWIRENRGGNVATPQFIALAESISGQELDEFFRVWLFTPQRPAELDSAAASRVQSRSTSGRRAVRAPNGRLIRVG